MNTSHLFGRVDSSPGERNGRGAAVAFNVWGELMALRDSEAGKSGAARRMLAQYDGFRIDLISLTSGAKIGRHVNAGRISVQCVAGVIRIHTETRDYDLPAGEVLVLDSGVWHDVEARHESAFLLTVALPHADIPAFYNQARWVLPPAETAVSQ